MPQRETSFAGEIRATAARKRDNLEKFKRQKGSDYLANEGFELACGSWTEMETIAIMVIQNILEGSNLVCNVANVSSVYRYFASSAPVTEMKLEIGQKRSVQIAAKISHLKERHGHTHVWWRWRS